NTDRLAAYLANGEHQTFVRVALEKAVEKPARRPRTRKSKDPALTPAAEGAPISPSTEPAAAAAEEQVAINAPAAELTPAPLAEQLNVTPPAQEPRAVAALQELGRDMFLTGLVSSHTGSLSVRQDDRMLTTRRGVMLSRLRLDD